MTALKMAIWPMALKQIILAVRQDCAELILLLIRMLCSNSSIAASCQPATPGLDYLT